ncbi:MAG: hypothetical protein KAX38_02370, partial [Candidatus Krumholzibacteria bacterium]|nr:hypothetical protein [Candidatus Krumholzibacteria bacterium]
MKLGLENIMRLLMLLGEPQKEFPAILVAGTNGKGSVVTYVSSILRASGLKVGTFYSPHLFRINERVRLNGDEIPSPVLDGILGKLRGFYDKAPFTFFEGMTAAAIFHFAREGVDLAVFEVGLGGRLDATRLVETVVTVITGISEDHREHLGRTRHSILKEKLGIVRTGVPLVANLAAKTLVETARSRCMAESAPFYDVRKESRAVLRLLGPERMVLDLTTASRNYRGLETRMIGRVQRVNIATAVRTVEVLVKARSVRGSTGGGRPERTEKLLHRSKGPGGVILKRLTARTVRDGVASAFLAGRFQVLPGTPRIILDVSHNEEALLEALDSLGSISS